MKFLNILTLVNLLSWILVSCLGVESQFDITDEKTLTVSLQDDNVTHAQCAANEYGPNCTQCIPQDTCSAGHYICDNTTGSKVCLPGYQGTDCLTTTEQSTVDYHVTCPENDCRNGGICTSGRCCCGRGFAGVLCEIEIIECKNESCLNGGVCKDLVGHFECICKQPYTGNNCETKVDTHAQTTPSHGKTCKTTRCVNGGSCFQDQYFVYCLCPTNFTGENCETDVRTKPVQTYNCPRDYYGAACTTFCRPKNDCHGHYVCDQVTGAKICLSGWHGSKCDTRFLPQSVDPECPEDTGCKNDGQCIDNECCCRHNYTGKFCQIESIGCLSNPCMNNGTCYNTGNAFTCVCVGNYTGKTCDHEIVPTTTTTITTTTSTPQTTSTPKITTTTPSETTTTDTRRTPKMTTITSETTTTQTTTTTTSEITTTTPPKTPPTTTTSETTTTSPHSNRPNATGISSTNANSNSVSPTPLDITTVTDSSSSKDSSSAPSTHYVISTSTKASIHSSLATTQVSQTSSIVDSSSVNKTNSSKPSLVLSSLSTTFSIENSAKSSSPVTISLTSSIQPSSSRISSSMTSLFSPTSSHLSSISSKEIMPSSSFISISGSPPVSNISPESSSSSIQSTLSKLPSSSTSSSASINFQTTPPVLASSLLSTSIGSSESSHTTILSSMSKFDSSSSNFEATVTSPLIETSNNTAGYSKTSSISTTSIISPNKQTNNISPTTSEDHITRLRTSLSTTSTILSSVPLASMSVHDNFGIPTSTVQHTGSDVFSTITPDGTSHSDKGISTNWKIALIVLGGVLLLLLLIILIVILRVRQRRKDSMHISQKPEDLQGFSKEHFSVQPNLKNPTFDVSNDSDDDSVKHDIYIVNE